MSEVKEGLFDKLYAAGKEVLDAAKKPHVKNNLKRKLKAAYGDAAMKIVDAEMAIQKVRGNFDAYDINKVLDQKQTITLAKKLQDEIKGEYLELFGVEMPTEE